MLSTRPFVSFGTACSQCLRFLVWMVVFLNGEDDGVGFG